MCRQNRLEKIPTKETTVPDNEIIAFDTRLVPVIKMDEMKLCSENTVKCSLEV